MMNLFRSRILLVAAFASGLRAGDVPNTLALRKSPPFQAVLCPPADPYFSTLRDVIVLIQKANTGDPLAQHELGIRFLTGRNFSADTVKAAYWIRKAAEKKVLSARYNLGLLSNNGWGTEWNPFEAYRHFQVAAREGMKEARYVYGLLLTDGLVVERDIEEAVRWVGQAADSGYAPAQEAMEEFRRRGLVPDSGQPDPEQNHSEIGDDSAKTDSLKTGETPQAGSKAAEADARTVEDREPVDALLPGESKTAAGDSATLKMQAEVARILAEAEAGSPEALTLVGRWHETLDGPARDRVLAAAYYLRAIRTDSPWAPELLWKLIRRDGFFDALRTRAAAGDPIAKFTWANLNAYGYDRQLTEDRIVSYLEEAASAGITEASVQLGLMTLSGRGVTRDAEKGKALLLKAADAGSREARVRLWMMELALGGAAPNPALVDSLKKESDAGSMLSQEILGACYRDGIGIAASVPLSVQYYRKALQRGSRSAFAALKEMYDGLRPDDREFRIRD
jgi:TPR repeat protein